MCNRLRNISIEKNIHYSIVGNNTDGPFEVKVSSHLQLTRCPETAIVIGRVIEGKIKIGDVLQIKFHGKDPIWEVVKNLQLQKKDIPESVKMKSIGIQLSETSYQHLKDFNNAVLATVAR